MGDEAIVRLGLVGCGDIARSAHGPAAQASEKVAIGACCDVRPGAAQAFAAQFACRAWYVDYEEMIHSEHLDGVLLATWPNQHREQIEGSLAGGIRNILCEKALALTGDDALRIWEIVEQTDAFLMEGFMYRHHPAILRMAGILAEGAIGALDSVRAVFSAYDEEAADPEDPSRNWRQRRECGGGIPYDFACYCVNACQYYTGGIPTRVYCRGDLSERYDTINRMIASIEYDNGCVGLVESSKRADNSQELRLSGATGHLTLPVAWTVRECCEVTLQRSVAWARWDLQVLSVAPANSYQLQLDNFAGVVRGESWPMMPLAESVANAYTVEALVTSLLEKRVVDLAIPERICQAVRESAQ